MSNLLSVLGTLFGPIGAIFNAIFYEPIYNVLMLIYNLIHATGIYGGFGLSIIALTLLVRCALIPLTRKQLKSSRAMQELAPQINALKVQYRGDPQGLMKAQQDLYKEHGYSPISGCLPLLIQMPFLYALLFSFKNLLTDNLDKINAPIYPFLPHLTALPNTHFLWTSLNASDPLHILPFLAALFTLIQLRMAMPVRKKPAPGTPNDPTMQATQTTMYIMPVITFVFALSFPSGLALYWTVGAIFASTQQYFLAGWGSLFAGIPGLEHLVPPPKELPTATPPIGTAGMGRAGARSLVATSGRSSSSGASSSGASPAEPPPSGGLRGIFRQMREMGSAVAAQAEESSKARQAAKNGDNIVDALPAVSEPVNGTAKTDVGGNTAPANRRPRAAGKSPVLVPPPKKAELPEKAIQREATTPTAQLATATSAKTSANGTNPLPEIEISSVAAKSNGSGAPSSKSAVTTVRRPVNGKSGNGNSGNGTAAARRPSAGGNSKGSSSSSSRNRSANRPKGGR